MLEISSPIPAGVQIMDACQFLSWLDRLLLDVTFDLGYRGTLVSDIVGGELWVVEVPGVHVADVLMEDVIPELALVQ